MVIPKNKPIKDIQFESGDSFPIGFMTGQELKDRIKDLEEMDLISDEDVVVYGWPSSRKYDQMTIETMTIKELKDIMENVWGYGMLHELVIAGAAWTKQDGPNGPNMNLAYDI